MAKLDLIISDLRRKIRDAGFRPGDMIPTQRELAQEMGVSVVTMGNAMRFLQKEGVIAAIRGKGTIINALPDLKKSPAIGVIVGASTPDDPVLSWPINVLRQACVQTGRTMDVFMPTRENRAQFREWAKDFPVFVVFGATKPEMANLIGSFGKPVVFYGELYSEERVPWASQITVTLEMTASLCLQFLQSLGHRRMLLVRSRGSSYLESLGLHFQQQADEMDCELEQLPISLNTDGAEVGDYMESAAERPTAIIVDGGMRASRVLHQLTQRGISVPESVSLLAINGVATEYLITPDLSRVENCSPTLGRRILGMLDAMGGQHAVIREEMLPTLVWGKTCKPLL